MNELGLTLGEKALESIYDRAKSAIEKHAFDKKMQFIKYISIFSHLNSQEDIDRFFVLLNTSDSLRSRLFEMCDIALRSQSATGMAAVALLASNRLDYSNSTLLLSPTDYLYLNEIDKISENELRLFLFIVNLINTKNFNRDNGVSPSQKTDTSYYENAYHFHLHTDQIEIKFGKFVRTFSAEDFNLIASQLLRRSFFLPHTGAPEQGSGIHFSFNTGKISHFAFTELSKAAEIVDKAYSFEE